MESLAQEMLANEQKAILIWDAIVGERIAGKTKALYARDRKLIVEVENSTWMNELQFLKQEMIEKLNEKLGQWIIDDIHFLLKK